MITIKFFSLLREALDTEQLVLDLPESVVTVAALKEVLAQERGALWRDTLFQPNVVHAVNQRVVNPDHALSDGDEIAFFPPMTGG